MNFFRQCTRALNRILVGLVPHDTPPELIYFVTNRCNFRCNHCFNKNLGNGSEELTIQELERIIKSLKGRPIYTVSLSGGEPFFRKDLAEIVGLFSHYCKTRMFNIPSNGFMTDKILATVERICKENSRAAFRINISLDGLAEKHDTIRGVKGSFAAAIRTIHSLGTLAIPNLDSSSVCCTISRHNLPEMIAFQEFMNREKIEGGYNIARTNEHIPSIFVNQQTPDDGNIIPDEVQFDAIIRQLFARKKNKSLFRTIEDRAHLLSLVMGNRFLHGKTIRFNCPAGDRIGVMYHNGEVAICENYKPIGNLQEYNYDFLSLWNCTDARKQKAAVSNCNCAHPCFLNAAIMQRWWNLFWKPTI